MLWCAWLGIVSFLVEVGEAGGAGGAGGGTDADAGGGADAGDSGRDVLTALGFIILQSTLTC